MKLTETTTIHCLCERNPIVYALPKYSCSISRHYGHVWFVTPIATLCLTFLPKVSYSIRTTNLRQSGTQLATNQTSPKTLHHARKANNTIDLRQNIHKNGIQNEGPNLDD
jgi:hypothetical protein